MTKFVWCTIGTSPREMREAKAVIVEADTLEEAKRKVVEDAIVEDDPEEEAVLREAMLEEYGAEWFLQELNEEEGL